MAVLKLNECKDIVAFHKMPSEDRKYPKNWNTKAVLDRHLIVIDEAYELFRVGPGSEAKEIQEARACANAIAQKGRALGIHLVIATQRPDKDAVDSQTKANMAGRLCFKMADIPSSTTILGSKRAADLPKIQGRAIWRCGLDEIEIQAPNLGVEEAKSILAPFYSNTQTAQATPDSKPEVAEVPVKLPGSSPEQKNAMAIDE